MLTKTEAMRNEALQMCIKIIHDRKTANKAQIHEILHSFDGAQTTWKMNEETLIKLKQRLMPLMRTTPPKIVTDWQEAIRQPPPRCCHTCENYTEAGECKLFNLAPPAEFTQEVDQCESWVQEVPF